MKVSAVVVMLVGIVLVDDVLIVLMLFVLILFCRSLFVMLRVLLCRGGGGTHVRSSLLD